MSRLRSCDTKDALAAELPDDPALRDLLAAALLAYGVQREAGWLTRRLPIARLFHRLLPGAHIQRMPGRASFHVQYLQPGPTLPPLASVARSVTKRRLELRAAFLSCGSLSVSKHGGYHLEFVPHSPPLSERLERLVHAEHITLKTLTRRGHKLLYIKDSEQIITLLSAMGAFPTILQLEDLRAVRETKNRIQRIVNTEAANLDRTINAATSMREVIETLAIAPGLSALPRALREAAEIRLRYPLASLSELAAACSPPVSKSTLHGRLLSLRKKAQQASPDATANDAPQLVERRDR